MRSKQVRTAPRDAEGRIREATSPPQPPQPLLLRKQSLAHINSSPAAFHRRPGMPPALGVRVAHSRVVWALLLRLCEQAPAVAAGKHLSMRSQSPARLQAQLLPPPTTGAHCRRYQRHGRPSAAPGASGRPQHAVASGAKGEAQSPGAGSYPVYGRRREQAVPNGGKGQFSSLVYGAA